MVLFPAGRHPGRSCREGTRALGQREWAGPAVFTWDEQPFTYLRQDPPRRLTTHHRALVFMQHRLLPSQLPFPSASPSPPFWNLRATLLRARLLILYLFPQPSPIKRFLTTTMLKKERGPAFGGTNAGNVKVRSVLRQRGKGDFFSCRKNSSTIIMIMYG